ncbi:MAG: oligosaccharide flippase family protein [Candidatus Sumerlaeaceae bacterium]|nr:oligosaccharide flippase family protein [Candidatus Sumerlaeaceae bacterium]
MLSKLPLKGRFTRDVLWNVGSLAILGASGLIVNAVILAARGPDALGVFNQVFAFYIVLSQIAVGGLQFSALRHCSYVQDDREECARIASSALALVAMAGVVVCAGLFAARHWIGRVLDSPGVGEGIAYMAPGLLFFSLNKVLLMVLNGLRHMRAFAVFQALRYILLVAGIVGVIGLGWPAPRLALSLTFAEVILFVVVLVYLQVQVLKLSWILTPEFKAWMPRHISFGLRGVLSGVLTELNTRVDVLMIGLLMSDKQVGVYSFASTFAEGFAQLNNVIRQNADPVVGRLFSEGRQSEIQEVSRKIRRTFFPIMMGLGALLIATFPIVIYVLAKKDEVWGSWMVFAILVTGVALSSGYRPLISLLLQGGRPGAFSALIATSATLNVALNFALIPVLGINGSALATAVVFCGEAVGIIILARRLFGIRL